MPIIVCGISHKTASVALREQVVFASEKISLYLQDVMAGEGIRDVVLLSTCNRTELYCVADSVEQVVDWFCRQHTVARTLLEPALYLHVDQEAVTHLMQVACGLDSMVIGESQILGQLKDAFSESCAIGAVSPLFHRLFQQVFSVAKAVRTHTAIGACPVSISSSAVSLVKQHCQTSIGSTTVVLLGAGETIHLVMRYLKALNPLRIMIVNRSMDHAVELAEHYQVEAIEWSEIVRAIQQADVLISATGSAHPIVSRQMVEKREKPLLIVDIAVPRDVEEAVAELPEVHLKSIDDLVDVIQQNRQGREHAAEKAHEMIRQKSAEFLAWSHALDEVALTIRAYRNHVEVLCQTELVKARKQLDRGEDAVAVLSSFAKTFTNKLLHYPSVQLRQAGVDGRFDLLELTRQLFAISETNPEMI